MNELGLRDGDEVTVVVYVNKESAGEVVLTVVSRSEVMAEIFTEDAHTLLLMHEGLKAAQGCVDYHLHKPELQKLIEERVEELKRMIAEEGGEPPSPADELGEIPF